MFRFGFAAIVVASAVITAWPATAQEKKQEQPPISPLATITEVIGGKDGPKLTIVYSRPYSKDPKGDKIRKIWGELVPWGKPWRLGANKATAFETEAASWWVPRWSQPANTRCT